MIELTRLDGSPFILNADTIELVEQTPDTIVRLRDKNYCIVKESMQEVKERVIAYRRLCNVPDAWTRNTGE